MKHRKLMALTMAFTMAMSSQAMAGNWQKDQAGWWYQNDDGSYPCNRTQTIDGTAYEFDQMGYWIEGNKEGYLLLSDFSEAEQQYLFTMTGLASARSFADASRLSMDDAIESILYRTGFHFIQWYDLIDLEYGDNYGYYNYRAKAPDVKEAIKNVFYKDLDITPRQVTQQEWEKTGDYYYMMAPNGGVRYEGTINSIYSYGDGTYKISYRYDRAFREDLPRETNGEFYGTCVVKRNNHTKYLFGLLASECK